MRPRPSAQAAPVALRDRVGTDSRVSRIPAAPTPTRRLQDLGVGSRAASLSRGPSGSSGGDPVHEHGPVWPAAGPRSATPR